MFARFHQYLQRRLTGSSNIISDVLHSTLHSTCISHAVRTVCLAFCIVTVLNPPEPPSI